MKVTEIRDKFNKFFQSKGHKKHPSSPLIPIGDDTLLFANAGMNQFKDYFTGKANTDDKRAVTIQKCVRAGGKHNDLENVGFTARHHTFFEMLGNFSFGDYFKEEAISFAWEFLTKELKIPAEKLYVTVHTSDDEAEKIWNEKIGVPLDKIFRKGDKDNFWEMGEFGPCGPCSEIFYDHGEKYTTPNFTPGPGQDLLDDEQRYVEIWNLVFMQFEKTPEGQFPLPKPSVDTGMGLERVAAALQGKYWNYDTDCFTPILNEIEKVSGKKYTDEKYTTSMRVVADHIRSSTMLITDGVIPSNEGRGYVLRRIIRRAVRHLRELGAPAGSFYKLAPVVLDTLAKEYPQNIKNADMAQKFLENEESKFLETLDNGLKFLNEAIEGQKGKTFDGAAAFKLYDTYGFPLDLTEVILAERGLDLDTEGFDKAMAKQKETSKKSWKGGAVVDDKIFFDALNKHGETQFTGYDSLESSSKLQQIIKTDNGDLLIFDKTPFYGESGGQAGDQGYVIAGEKQIEITDTQKPVDGLFAHYVESSEGLEECENYQIKVDSLVRNNTAKNHSATHLLQAALIKVLGNHVKQAGSMVTADRLRFDFTHMKALTTEELDRVERLVNEQISQSLSVDANLMSMDQAMESGAMALFGEKYGDEVRVLTMGEFSTELCGGTHVANTSDIGLFTILSEGSLSTGVRRIEATTATHAYDYLKSRSSILKTLELDLSAKNELVLDKVNSLQSQIKNLEKEKKQLVDKLNSAESSSLFENVTKIGGCDFVVAQAKEGSDLRKLSDLFVKKFDNGVLAMSAPNKGKLAIIVRRSKKLDQVKCNEILKEAISTINGRGGGKPDMAQGSGDLGNDKAFFDQAKVILEKQLQG
ncbi:MAG: alanine--tRNA ligase [Oligoflexia bacterium]|nr:alanine--tRNA ligase [Oligoflexia bacterium]